MKHETKSKPKFNAEKIQGQIRTLQWALAVTMFLGIVTFLVLLHVLKNGVQTERIEVIPVKIIEKAPYETISYVCTSGVTVKDYRKGCGEYRCELWFNGEGTCAVVLP